MIGSIPSVSQFDFDWEYYLLSACAALAAAGAIFVVFFAM